MAGLILLPATTCKPPPPVSRGRMLNPIIEEVGEDQSLPQMMWRNKQTDNKIQHWLSPQSNDLPTPRGLHFLSAPVVPLSSSSFCAAAGDVKAGNGSSDWSASSLFTPPGSHVAEGQRVSTTATEFDENQHDTSGLEVRFSKRQTPISKGRGTTPELVPLLIPAIQHEAVGSMRDEKLQHVSPPVPLTPPSRVEMSPAAKSFMMARQHQAIPTVSAPPSLDGSLNSEELAALSAPPTPVIGTADDKQAGWAGVQLQPGALETLQALSGNEPELGQKPNAHSSPVIQIPTMPLPKMRQQGPRLLRLVTTPSSGVVPRASMLHLPARQSSDPSFAGLTRLNIPSPGGFFSDLSSASRETWGSRPTSENDNDEDDDDVVAPATSTTAEKFYRTPWAAENDAVPPPPPLLTQPGDAIIEQVLEAPVDNLNDLATAIQIQSTPRPLTAIKVTHGPGPDDEPVTPGLVGDVTEIVADYDASYPRKQQEAALSHLERTGMWLMAQQVYMSGVQSGDETLRRNQYRDQEDSNESSEDDEGNSKTALTAVIKTVGEDEAATEPLEPCKKRVRFSELPTVPCSLPSDLPARLVRQESAYYRAFTDATVRSQAGDVFVHQLPRFEALQSQRVALGGMHRNQLLGKFQLSAVPQSAKKRISANVVRGDDELVDDPAKIRADKEVEARRQMEMATWHVASIRHLNGGHLVAAPVANRLARLGSHPRASPDRTRILDLAGVGACDWAWHAAVQYPYAKVYTVTTKQIRQLSNSNVRGPPNHRQVAVDRLTRLPFADGHFDLVSARELHTVLKLVGENGCDEWDQCLRECLRVLKPGGFLEFSLLDADIINAGPLGNQKAVEFSFTLKTLGYDPSPSRLFVQRLARAGFEDVRRAWLCLLMGPRPTGPKGKTGDRQGDMHRDAIVSGSADRVAGITGLAAGWSWERWLLRAETEKTQGEMRLADIVNPGGEAMRKVSNMMHDLHAVVDEGRTHGSAFRLLRGHARKPSFVPTGVDRMGTIKMTLDTTSL